MSAFFFVVVSGCFLCFCFFWLKNRASPTKRRHRRNVKTARRIYAKLSKFSGDHRGAQTITYLRKIDPYVFEELILEAFQQRGYRIKRNKSYSADGGVDGRIYDQKGNLIMIQAKRYCGHIKLEHVKQFSALVNAEAVHGYFVHTGKTSRASSSVSENVTIISGARLASFFV